MTRVVAITGATGLLGSYIARLLLADVRNIVRASRRSTSTAVLLGSDASRIDWVTGDLRDASIQEELLEGVDVLVHCAGLVSYRPTDTKLLREMNVGVTEDLINLALEYQLAHFVHISSIAAISPAPGIAVTQEQHQTFYPTRSTSRYARSKHAAELHVWRGKEEGLQVSVLNPAVILGAGFWDSGSPRLFSWVAAGQHFYPTGSTGYVDVRDVAAFAKTCIDDQLVGERYILSAENWTYKHFFDAVAAAIGVEPPSRPVRDWQAELAWRAEGARALLTRKQPLLTKESARRSMTLGAYDNSKSLAAGAHYRPVEESIEDVAELYGQTKEQGYAVLGLVS